MRGLPATTVAPRSTATSSAESILGWLVPGFWPTQMIVSASWMSSRVTVPLPMPIACPSAVPDDSWHMFEQSGRLFVPKVRTKSW